MLRLDAEQEVRFCEGLTRRDFLHTGALASLGLALPDLFELKAKGAVKSETEINCIFLMLVGGPSHLDCWDLKPDAPSEIRGPFKPIKTNVAGIEISEIFPRTARHADKFALLRSLHHEASAYHDTGHQLMQTGRLFEDGIQYPHLGSILSNLRGPRAQMPAHVLLPRPIGNTGGNMAHGQNAGFLGEQFDPFLFDPEVSSHQAHEAFDLTGESAATRDRYGRNRFGTSCLLARRLVERGVRFVTVNMFETVFHEITWDIHGSMPFSPISCYRDYVGPMFDHAYASLLEDLHDRGLLRNTLVVATGEFGREPKINPAGGRDHWPQCWTMLFAGGGIKGGQVVGSSDEIGAYPKDRPTTPPEVVATILRSLGIDLNSTLPGPDGEPIRIVENDVTPIIELF